jgi:hypothetical protein
LSRSRHSVLLEAVVILAAAGVAAMVASDPGLARSQTAPGNLLRPAFALGDVRQGPAVRSSLLAQPSLCAAGRKPGSYVWPVKPFEVQHPIRAFFGDPRTVFRAAHDAGLGAFSFHNGVDIVAADGTPVYPVLSGTVTKVKPDEIVVALPAATRTFQYWHLKPLVRLHEHVRAQHTALGTVRPGRGHVHLTEIDGTTVENPLQPGHLTPYRDDTPPSVGELYFLDPLGRTLNPEALTGSVDFTAAAVDTPPLPLPAPWSGVPVTPARLSWQLQTLRGQALLSEQTAADFSVTIPPSDRFSSVYAEGTYQNFPAVGAHYLYGTPGDYLFNLNPRPLDTTLMPPGRYRLTVVAADTCGNRGILSEQIRVLPQPGATLLTGAILRTLARRHPVARPPRRFWTVVIATLPAAEGLAPAQAVIRQALEARLRPVGLLATSTARHPRSGDDVVFTGFYYSWGRAYMAAQSAVALFPSAQPREVVQQPRPSRTPKRRTPHDSERGGRYTVVLASLPARGGHSAARALRLAASSSGLPFVRVILSSRFTSLESGYVAVVSGHYRTGEAATHAARRDARLYPRAYVRELIANAATADPRAAVRAASWSLR